MIPTDFLAALKALGWTPRQLARELSCDPHIPLRWKLGTAAIPPVVERWLLSRQKAASRLPAPVWKRR